MECQRLCGAKIFVEKDGMVVTPLQMRRSGGDIHSHPRIWPEFKGKDRSPDDVFAMLNFLRDTCSDAACISDYGLAYRQFEDPSWCHSNKPPEGPWISADKHRGRSRSASTKSRDGSGASSGGGSGGRGSSSDGHGKGGKNGKGRGGGRK